jgi:acyl carrier protein
MKGVDQMNLSNIKNKIFEILVRDYNLDKHNVSSETLIEVITSSIDLLEFFLMLEKEFDIQFKYEEMNYDMIKDIEILSEIILKHLASQ